MRVAQSAVHLDLEGGPSSRGLLEGERSEKVC